MSKRETEEEEVSDHFKSYLFQLNKLELWFFFGMARKEHIFQKCSFKKEVDLRVWGGEHYNLSFNSVENNFRFLKRSCGITQTFSPPKTHSDRRVHGRDRAVQVDEEGQDREPDLCPRLPRRTRRGSPDQYEVLHQRHLPGCEILQYLWKQFWNSFQMICFIGIGIIFM